MAGQQSLRGESKDMPTLTNKDVEAFTAFDSYPWQFDKDFLQGALQITKGLERAQALISLRQARIWWYESKQNLTVNVAEYGIFDLLRGQYPNLPKNPEGGILAKINAIRKHMDESEEKRAAEEAAKIPGWQKYAQKANLHLKANQAGAEVQRDSVAGSVASQSTLEGDASTQSLNNGSALAGGEAAGAPTESAPYPDNFKLIAEAVINNKPVPGVKLIPNTVLRPSGVTPVGTMRAPLKPWERKKAAAVGEVASNSSSTAELLETPDTSSLLANVLDKEFPPLDPTAHADLRKEEDATMMEG